MTQALPCTQLVFSADSLAPGCAPHVGAEIGTISDDRV